MISLSNYFENDKLILQETLVDNIFDLIDTNTLDSQINTSGIVQLKQKLENYTHVKLEFWKNQNNQVDGDFERPNIINIYLHSNATYGHVLQVFLHEFSHFVTDHKLPILVKFKKPSFGNVLFTDNKDNIRDFLDYVFQLRELPNFALSSVLKTASILFTVITYVTFFETLILLYLPSPRPRQFLVALTYKVFVSA